MLLEKMRVYELAKALNVDSKEVIWACRQLGLEVKNHMSTMDGPTVEKVTEFLRDPKKALAEQEARRQEALKAESVRLKKQEQQQPRVAVPPVKGARQEPPRPAVERRARLESSPDRPARPAVMTRPGGLMPPPGMPSRQAASPRTEGPSARKPGWAGASPGQGRLSGAGTRPGPREGHHAYSPPARRTTEGYRPRREAAGPAGLQPRPATADRGGAPRPPYRKEGISPFRREGPALSPPRPVAPQEKQKPRWEKGRHRVEAPAREREEKVIRLEERRRRHSEMAERALPRKVVIEGPITVKDLAQKLGTGVPDLIKRLMGLGVMASINQYIDADVAVILASELGLEVEQKVRETPEEELLRLQQEQDDPALLRPRPPVVTVMGHVDHGKTSLLDAIRETNVTAREAGGITQHIGAYTVELDGRKVVFLDTPGHEAFTAMRARGAKVTDIAVLVVAADDGVMPQTVEAINHARAARVPIVVAINKIDKPNANPQRVKQQLTEHGLVPEEWGGDTICVPVSAKARTGLDTLLEMILLVAEMQELKANPNRAARGTVIEAQVDKGRGPVATVLVQSGTLRTGDPFIAGNTYGKVRAMMDDKGRRIKKATPSIPVEVLGFADVPQAGDELMVTPDEKTAREISSLRQMRKREEDMEASQRVGLEELFRQAAEGGVRDLNLVVKGDVQGTVEAVTSSLEKLQNEEVRVNIIHSGVGAVNESDVMLAAASRAVIIGFNVRPDVNARRAAEREKVDIRTYRVIYEAIDDIKAALKGMLQPRFREVVLGRAEVRATFKIPKVGTVAGCYVNDGKVLKSGKVRVLRDGAVVHEGRIESLRRFKDDVREVAAGFECGIGIEKFNDIKEGDILEVYLVEEVKEQ